VTFLLIDSQIVEEEFLEDINNILNSGEVPNLFEGDEFNGILRGFLQTFSSAVRVLSEPMVNACVDVYMRVANVMLPTPDRSHYIFNLRDLSKCIQGILQASNLHYNQENQILRLFYHETTRVFHDRLINQEDKNLFKSLMKDVCMDHFNRPVINDDEPPILFGDFMVFGKPKNERIYDEIKDHGKLESVLNDYISDYNSVAVGKRMKLILFQDAMEHTVRLARLLRSDRGNGLLVGVAGMGKQSLTRLASHVNEYNCWQIEMRRNYDLNAFHEDLRVLYRIAGVSTKYCYRIEGKFQIKLCIFNSTDRKSTGDLSIDRQPDRGGGVPRGYQQHSQFRPQLQGVP